MSVEEAVGIAESYKKRLQTSWSIFYGTEKRTRTSTGVTPPVPKTGVSTNSTIPAYYCYLVFLKNAILVSP